MVKWVHRPTNTELDVEQRGPGLAIAAGDCPVCGGSAFGGYELAIQCDNCKSWFEKVPEKHPLDVVDEILGQPVPRHENCRCVLEPIQEDSVHSTNAAIVAAYEQGQLEERKRCASIVEEWMAKKCECPTARDALSYALARIREP